MFLNSEMVGVKAYKIQSLTVIDAQKRSTWDWGLHCEVWHMEEAAGMATHRSSFRDMRPRNNL